MRKQFLLMLILCLTASMAWAERIDVATARKVAESVAQRESPSGGLRSAGELSLVYAAAPGQSGSALRSGTMEGSADYFVFNFPGGKGFAIVAGDDRVRPVLGYSDEGGFDPDNLPENLRGMLAYYQDQITWANNKGIDATPDIAAEWSRYMSGTALRAAGEPVLLNTAKWNQGEPYNRQTPIFDTEYGPQHAVTGCVATALGIVMRFHEYPDIVTSDERITEYYQLPVTYEAYDWSKMPLVYTPGYSEEEANAVAALMWNIGANVEMEYGANGSGAVTSNAVMKLNTVFGYSEEVQFVWKSDYRWTEWKQMVRTELDNGRPVIYSGSNTEGGHAFICDGYKENEAFHINWGWGGNGNGYFLLTALDSEGGDNPYVLSGMGIGIHPPREGDTKPHLLKYRSLGCDQVKVGENFYISVRCHNIGTESMTAKIDMAVIAADGTIKKRIGTDNPLHEVSVDVNYISDVSVLVNLSEALLDGEVILPVYSEDGVNWKVMTGIVDAPLHITMEGVQSGEDDPGDPEVRPINAGIYWNNLDNVLMPISGLDNSKQNWDNTKGISYSLVNATENIIIRYTLNGYNDWVGKLDVYKGDNSLYGANQGEKVSIGADGSFDITVSPSQIEEGTYVHYLKILSDKGGELIYDIRILTESNPSETLFEQLGNKMGFVNKAETHIEPHPLRGTINQEIPFSIKVSGMDDILIGKELDLKIYFSGIKKEQVQLFGTDGKELALEAYTNSETSLYMPGFAAAGTIAKEQSYSFKFKVNAAFPAGESTSPYIYVYPYVAGNEIPATAYSSEIIIDPVAVTTYKIQTNLTDLKLAEYAQTVIEEGKPFNYPLLCEKEGYRLPASIAVTMGGTTLVAGTGYTYDSTNGRINIPAVTGDVVITAAAEPIPAITYTITVGQLEKIESNLPLIVKEGDNLITIVLRPKEGYLLPETVTIKAGDKELTAGTDYRYVPSKDRKVAEIQFDKVTSDLQLYAIAVPEPKIFTIRQELSHLTSDKANEVEVTENSEQATNYTITLKPEANYKLPDAITIMNGNTPLTQGADKDYTYDRSSGKVVVFKVTSDLMIKAVGIDASQIQVVLNLEGVVITTSDAKEYYEINSLPHFMLDLNAAEGYTYDGSIVVKMGDKELDPNTDYNYVYENDSFELKIPLTATLTISAKGVKKQYAVDVKAMNLTATPKVETVAHGDPLAFKLVPNEGYNLPEAIEVKMAGKVLIASEDYTYNKVDGTVSIATVTGKVEVTAEAVLRQYDVKLNLIALTSNFTAGKIGHGLVLEMQLSVVSNDFQLPKKITVKMNDQEFSDYKYENGWLYIGAGKIIGPISITAEAVKSYPVSDNTENLTIDGLENVVEGETFTTTLNAASGYHLPYAISVIMGGRPLNAGEYTYDRQTGKIEIPNVSGPISIVAKGVEDGKFEVVLNLTNLASDPASFEPQAKDTKIELTLKPSSGYELPGSVIVEMGETTLVAGTDYAYDRSTGKFTLEKITGTLVITASGSRIPDPTPDPDPTPTPTTYTVTLPVVEGAVITAAGSTTVEEGKSFSFTVDVKEGYKADNLVVKANGTTLTPDANGRYTIANIRSNVVVTVSGIVKGDDPTANETIHSDELRVWGANGRLFIQTPVADTAYIVTFNGRLYKTLSLPAGEYVEDMPQGSYIIYIGKQSYKLKF
ncbi:C10 family peptidase [Parabacteroides sp.]